MHSDASKQEMMTQCFKLLGLIMLIVVLVILVIVGRQYGKPKITAKPPVKFSAASSVLPEEKAILNQAQRRAQDAEMKAKELEEQLQDLKKKQAQVIDALQGRMASLESSVQHAREISATNVDDPLASHFNEHTVNMRRDKLHLTHIDRHLSQPIKNPNTYVPGGSFVKAVMLGGADTSTSASARDNPEPMLFKIIEDGTLPNGKHSHLKGCLVVGRVFGDISSERGEIRTRSMSCVLPNDEIVDQRVEGYIFGPEGKYGVRGNPLWREGALLQRAFVAGSLSGFGEGLQNKYTTTSISPLGSTQTVNNGDILKFGLASGAANAMNKLAEYNIRRADLYHPVIQISAGTVVDIVFRQGFFLDGKTHRENTASNKEIHFDRGDQVRSSISSNFNQQRAEQLAQQSQSLSTQLKNSKWEED